MLGDTWRLAIDFSVLMSYSRSALVSPISFIHLSLSTNLDIGISIGVSTDIRFSAHIGVVHKIESNRKRHFDNCRMIFELSACGNLLTTDNDTASQIQSSCQPARYDSSSLGQIVLHRLCRQYDLIRFDMQVQVPHVLDVLDFLPELLAHKRRHEGEGGLNPEARMDNV